MSKNKKEELQYNIVWMSSIKLSGAIVLARRGALIKIRGGIMRRKHVVFVWRTDRVLSHHRRCRRSRCIEHLVGVGVWVHQHSGYVSAADAAILVQARHEIAGCGHHEAFSVLCHGCGRKWMIDAEAMIQCRCRGITASGHSGDGHHRRVVCYGTGGRPALEVVVRRHLMLVMSADRPMIGGVP